MSDELATVPAPAMPDDTFAVYAEAEGHQRPLLQIGLSFARLMDDVVVPYQSSATFFIDGAPVTDAKLRRIKILKLGSNFAHARANFGRRLDRSDAPTMKLHGEQYTVRFEHLLREHSEDVTAQVIQAFNRAIRPSLKDYLPKRDELIPAALGLFTAGMKALGGGG